MNAQPSPSKKELQIKSDKNNDYNVEIFIDSNSFLNIIIKNIDKTVVNQYKGKYSLDEMKKKNKYFYVSENISEAFYLLEPYLNKNSLIEKMNELVFTINIPNPLSPKIDFILNVEKKDYNSLLNEHTEIINKQNNKINELTEIINKQNDKINQQNNKINLLGPTINNILEKINQLILKNTYLWELKLYIKLF